MNSLGEIEEHIFSMVVMEEGFIMNDIQMVIDKFLLDCPVIAFNNAVDLSVKRIAEVFNSRLSRVS
jgi:hypothetical protein